jgi:hypothetical protein
MHVASPERRFSVRALRTPPGRPLRDKQHGRPMYGFRGPFASPLELAFNVVCPCRELGP